MRTMRDTKTSRGFALITSLLLLLLLTAIAVGTVYLVSTEVSVGGNDLEDTRAFYGAEAAMEKMMVDVGNLYAVQGAPAIADITALAGTAYQPTITGITYNTYLFTVAPDLNTPLLPAQVTRNISSGPNQGLIAEIVPLTLTVDAQRTFSGADVRMIRNVEVALIPIFQFGVFSDGDVAYFPTPNFDFNGRVATNGNLWLAGGAVLTFHSKITAYGQIIRKYFTNGVNAQTAAQYNNNFVMIPTAANGCDGAKPNCRKLDWTEGSVTGNLGSTPNGNWTTLSKTTYGGLIANGATGVRPLSLPFVGGGFRNIEIIRRPWPNELTGSDVYQSRMYGNAQIRVLLNDTAAGLPTGGTPARLANVAPYYDSPSGKFGTATYGSTSNPAFAEAMTYTDSTGTTPVYEPGLASPTGGTCTYLDTTNPCWHKVCTTIFGKKSCPGVVTYPNPPSPSYNALSGLSYGNNRQDFINPNPGLPAGTPGQGCMDQAAVDTAYVPNVAHPSNHLNNNCWPLIDGYLLVQARQGDGSYVDVTYEWLSFGISRDGGNCPNPGQLNYNPASGTTLVSTNCTGTGYATPITNNAILKFQTYRNIDLAFSPNTFDVTGYATTPGAGTASVTPAVSLTDQNPGKYYPIQMYDPREGLFRDSAPGIATQCPANGVINIIELDVNNLRRWLSGALVPTPTTGQGQNVASNNGYVFYFSDRRGMQNDPNAPAVGGGTAARLTGGFGFEDVVNPLAAATGANAGLPNGTLDTGEDSNQNGRLDTWGAASVGTGFNPNQGQAGYVPPTGAPGSPGNPSPYATGAAWYAVDPLLKIGNLNYTNTTAGILQSCTNTARKNRVTGARHALRLVNATLGYLPAGPGNVTGLAIGGFTVASENPVYVLGEFNANAAQAFTEPGCSTTLTTPCHVSSAIIADSVTLLSNPGNGTTSGPANPGWSDANDWLYPMAGPGINPNRQAQTTYYRIAIAGGKNVSFPLPTNMVGSVTDFGTDGGVHNFLRYIEGWGSAGLFYKGSIVSLYYSEYSTSIYKGTTTVYTAPSRGYSFDIDFLSLATLPPGTPKFRDVDNVGFQQIFTPY